MRFANWILTCALAGSAAAQAPSDAALANIPIEDVGTLNLVTGVLTPPSPGGSQNAGTGVIYDNTCLPFAPAAPNGCGVVYINYLSAGQTYVDEGRVPSATSIAPNVGTMNAYRVTQFRITYYTSEQDPTIGGPGCRLTIKFWNDYDACTNLATAPAATATFNLVLPGSTVPLATQGKSLNISLAGGMEFTLKADANGSFDNNPSLDTFGYGFNVVTLTPGEQTAITRAGQPSPSSLNPCGVGDATYYLNSTNAAGTGLDDGNTFWFQQNATLGTCVTGAASVSPCAGVSGPNHGGYYMRIWADLTDCNGNLLPDADDISSGASFDVNANGIPDECEGSNVVVYCTAGTTLNNCLASISATGQPSVSAASGFIVDVDFLEGQKQGIIFYGTSIPIGAPWGTSTSFLCVKAPTQRTGVQGSGGTLNACDGSLTLDFFNYLSTHPTALGNPFSAGQNAYFQGWFRDQGSSKTTSLSDGLAVTFLP